MQNLIFVVYMCRARGRVDKIIIDNFCGDPDKKAEVKIGHMQRCHGLTFALQTRKIDYFYVRCLSGRCFVSPYRHEGQFGIFTFDPLKTAGVAMGFRK